MHTAQQPQHSLAPTPAPSGEAVVSLPVALPESQLEVRYQPIVDLQSGAVASLEASVVWRHPQLGLLPARRFLPQADADGAALPLSRWLLNQVCDELLGWRQRGHADLKVMINVSPRQFRDAGLADYAGGLLERCSLPASALGLALTEAVLATAGVDCAARLDAYARRGLALTLDDFGTGGASLDHLKRHPFATLKIAAGFVRDVASEAGDAALCEAVIGLAHHLGMKVMAAGVETEQQCDFLRRNLCDQIQGDFFSAPLAAAQVGQLLASARALPAHLVRMPSRQRRLLLVDDEPNIVAALQRLLRKDQYQIFSADSGQQGLELLARGAVDVIVSDQRMPGMLGADFLRRAREMYPDTIRIMLSGYTELQSVTDAVNEGAIYKFLTKPWDDEQLRGHIAEAFRIKESADDNRRLHLEVRSANQELAEANRRLKQLLLEKQQQISLVEINLNVARELLQYLPLAVIGLDDTGMIAFINGACESLFHHSGALLGNDASVVLPQLFAREAGADLAPGGADGAHRRHWAVIDGRRYLVVRYAMGGQSSSRGSLITLSLASESA